MCNRHNRMDSCLHGCKADNRRAGQAGLVWIVALAVVLLASAGPALGQFTVEPLKLDLQVRPGRLVKSVIQIQNVDPNETQTIDLSVADLTQNEEGSWEIIEPNSGFDTSGLSSCKEEVRLSASTVTIGPLQRVPVEVTARVPRGSRGFSCAGILATLKPRGDETEVSFILRFMVPILVEVQGRPVRHEVEAKDLAMKFVPASSGMSATTTLVMAVENKGGSFPRCRPVARIWSWSGGHWRTITTTAFQDNTTDVGILPGAKINIETNLRKSLPPGKYKVAGVLYVDGMRRPRVEKIIDFAGDPSVTRVAADTPLDLIPSGVTVESIPGATRTATLKVYNGSDETVKIKATLALPRDLAIKVINNVRGVDMDCTPWVTISPDEFILSGEAGVQTVRITAAMPDAAMMIPSYYSNLELWAFYPDGQYAGLTTAKICVLNTKVQGEPSAKAVKMYPVAISGSKYQIVAQFSNNGTVHFDPKNCKAAVTMITSAVPRAGVRLDSVVAGAGAMLPGEERGFSGILDFATLDADTYRLSAALEYAPGKWATKQAAIEVSIEGDQRVVNITGVEEDLPEILEVKWR